MGNTKTLTIPGCSDICPLDSIRKSIQDLLPLGTREEYCRPMDPLLLAQYKKYQDIMGILLPGEYMAEHQKFMDSYLKNEIVDLR